MTLWKTLWGNHIPGNGFEYSSKKMWFQVLSLVTLVMPLVAAFSGWVSWTQYLDYLKVVFPSASILYAGGKWIDNAGAGPRNGPGAA